jgi:beta-phosphoglucomutase-like phosphatase (HAD superfamily)
MADGVLLDWEGVLADTGAARRDALRAALAATVDAPGDSSAAGLGPSARNDHVVTPSERSSPVIPSERSAPVIPSERSSPVIPSERSAPVIPSERSESRNLDELATSGLSFHAVAARVAGDLADPTLVDLIAMRAGRELAARLAQGFALNASAARFVERVQLRGPVVVVTAAGRVETEAALRLAGLLDSFAAIVTADDVSEAPSREAYDRAVEHLARRRPVRRGGLIVLGATRPALRAAREAGLRSVAVGVPAHAAVEADAAIASLEGATVEALDALLRGATERPA